MTNKKSSDSHQDFAAFNLTLNHREFAKREGCWEIIKKKQMQWSKKINQYLLLDDEIKRKNNSKHLIQFL